MSKTVINIDTVIINNLTSLGYTEEQIQEAIMHLKTLDHHKKYYQEHSDERLAYRNTHREEIRARERRYDKEHATERLPNIKTNFRRYYQRNSAKILAAHKLMHQQHPEWHRNQNYKRRGAEGHYTYDEWNNKLMEYGHRCAYCGTLESNTVEGKLTVDHVIPISKGGTNYIDNLVPACSLCNNEKFTSTAIEFLDRIKKGNQSNVLKRRQIAEQVHYGA